MRDKLDEVLVELAQSGDREAANALAERYEKFIRYLCKPYFAKDYTKSDIVQEGFIGFLKAIRMYRTNGCPFQQYARMSVIAQLNSMVRSLHREKRYANILSFSAEKPIFTENEEKTLLSILQSTEKSPEEIIIEREEIEEFYAKIKAYLSPLEQKVIMGYLDDKSYSEIARETGYPPKTVDNAIQRAKKKLRAVCQINEEEIEHEMLFPSRLTPVNLFVGYRRLNERR